MDEKIFYVGVREVHYAYYTIKATTSTEALQKIADMFDNRDEILDDRFSHLEYSHTSPKDQWVVAR